MQQTNFTFIPACTTTFEPSLVYIVNYKYKYLRHKCFWRAHMLFPRWWS